MIKKRVKDKCWSCGGLMREDGEVLKCDECGATYTGLGRVGPSPLGSPAFTGAEEKGGYLAGTPAASVVEKFKMPTRVKKLGRKPIKEQPALTDMEK